MVKDVGWGAGITGVQRSREGKAFRVVNAASAAKR
jgi:hypothetical protein